MESYLLILSIPALLALQFRRRLHSFAWVFVFLILVVFMGLRDEIGPDWFQYESMHRLIIDEDLNYLLTNSEPLSSLLFWISEHSGYGIYLSNFVAATIMLIGTFSFALRTNNPWLAIVCACPYFLFVIGMSGIRQAMAAGIALYVLSKWEKFSMSKRLAYILTASFFHTSALMNSIFLVTQLRIGVFYKCLLSGVVSLIAFFVGSEVAVFSTSFDSYHIRYLQDGRSVQSLGSLYHVAFVAIPAMLGFHFRRQIRPYLSNYNLFVFGGLAALSLILLNFISSTMASRLTIYMYFIPMMVFPALTMIYQGRVRQVVTVGVVLYNVLILLVWFSLANHNTQYIPYKNVLF